MPVLDKNFNKSDKYGFKMINIATKKIKKEINYEEHYNINMIYDNKHSFVFFMEGRGNTRRCSIVYSI